MLERFRIDDPMQTIKAIVSQEELLQLQQDRKAIRVESSVRDYIVRISEATRSNVDISLGASPRATLALYQVSQAWAALQGRDYVLPDDVKKITPHVLSHRLIIAPHAQLRGRNVQELISDIVGSVSVPVES